MKIAVVLLFVLVVFLAPGPVVPDEDLAGAEGAATATADPPAQQPDEEPLEKFVPSEKVSADSSISFPVDI
jgi:hypothetical protein